MKWYSLKKTRLRDKRYGSYKPLMRMLLTSCVTLVRSPLLRFHFVIHKMRESDKMMSKSVVFPLFYLVFVGSLGVCIWNLVELDPVLWNSHIIERLCTFDSFFLFLCVFVGIQSQSQNNRGHCYLKEICDDSLWSKQNFVMQMFIVKCLFCKFPF